MIRGRVASGLGEGVHFTGLDWVREQFTAALGIDPHPGTLNVELDPAVAAEAWELLEGGASHRIRSSEARWCDGQAYPVRIGTGLPAAVVRPQVAGYPPTKVELVAAVDLRTHLGLRDGDLLSIAPAPKLTPRCVIFDVDGTLVDSINAYHILADQVARPHGFGVSREQICEALNSSSRPNFWELVVPAEYPQRDEFTARLAREAAALWPDVLREHGPVIPGLGETLALLRAQGRRLALVTASHIGSFQPLQDADLMDLFEVVVTGADVQRRKPDPEGLQRCIGRMGVDPADAVYVGDAPVDVAASRAAGIAAVAVLTGAGDSALLSAACPERIVGSHRELPGLFGAIEPDATPAPQPL